MKKLIALFAACLMLGLGSVSAAPHSVAPVKQGSYLFFIAAKKGQILPADNGQYTLSLGASDLDTIIMYGTGSSPSVRRITGQELVKMWREGNHSFSARPPNAILSASNLKQAVIVLMGVQVKKSTLVYHFKPAKDQKISPQKIYNVTLGIDSDPYKCKYKDWVYCVVTQSCGPAGLPGWCF
jgi:hypothetical protein